MDTLPTEIMMFRELRESILSEEDAATYIRISRQLPDKVLLGALGGDRFETLKFVLAST
jgi:hypothetical protein